MSKTETPKKEIPEYLLDIIGSRQGFTEDRVRAAYSFITSDEISLRSKVYRVVEMGVELDAFKKRMRAVNIITQNADIMDEPTAEKISWIFNERALDKAQNPGVRE